jgi:hypothetical protein
LPGSDETEGDVMNTTTAATPVTAGNSWTRALRVALIPLAIVVLFVASFVLGRTTASTAQHVPAPTTVATHPVSCRFGPC